MTYSTHPFRPVVGNATLAVLEDEYEALTGRRYECLAVAAGSALVWRQ